MGKKLALKYKNALGEFVDVSGVGSTELFTNMDGYTGDSKDLEFRIELVDDGIVSNTILSYKNIMLGFSMLSGGSRIKLNSVNDKFVLSDYVYAGKVRYGVTKAGTVLTPDSNGLFAMTNLLNVGGVNFIVTNKLIERIVTDYGELMTITNIFFDVYAIPN